MEAFSQVVRKAPWVLLLDGEMHGCASCRCVCSQQAWAVLMLWFAASVAWRRSWLAALRPLLALWRVAAAGRPQLRCMGADAGTGRPGAPPERCPWHHLCVQAAAAGGAARAGDGAGAACGVCAEAPAHLAGAVQRICPRTSACGCLLRQLWSGAMIVSSPPLNPPPGPPLPQTDVEAGLLPTFEYLQVCCALY